MNQPSSNFVTHDGRTIGQRLKRWSTAGWVLTLTGFLLIALYSLLNPKTFTVPVMAQTCDPLCNGNFESGLSPWVGNAGVDHGYLDITHGHGVTLTGAAAEIYQLVTPAETGVYSFTFEFSRGCCVNSHYLEVFITTTSANVQTYTKEYGASDHAWHQAPDTLLLLEAGSTYTVAFSPKEGTSYHLDNVSLIKMHDEEEIDIETGLLVNGDFIGPAGWTYDNSFHILDNGAYNLTSTVGAGWVGQAASPPSRLYQLRAPSTHGIYQFSYIYKRGGTNTDRLYAAIETTNPHAKPYTHTHQMNFSGWQSAPETPYLLLNAGTPYTVTLSSLANAPVYYDNVSLLKLFDVTDSDTGLIRNGDFIGPEEWVYSDNAKYNMTVGTTITQLGAVELYQVGEAITQTGITIEGTNSKIASLSFDCQTDENSVDVIYTIQPSDPQAPVITEEITCLGYAFGWTNYTSHAIILAPGTYTFSLKFDSLTGNANQAFIDNISLLQPPFKDEMDLNKHKDTCNGVTPPTSVTWWTGDPINTRNGNLSHQETDLSIPVAGCRLEFFRSYASQGVGYYTTTMGYGWTHNYDMRLHFDNTLFPNSVDFQVGNGSRMPFIDQGDGTYRPYAGVTGEMSQVGSTYVITGANQKVYTFNANGRILSQADPHGNTIAFSYSNGLLTQVGQGSRTLTYSYDGQDRLVHVADHTGRTITLTYNANNELRSATNPLGQTTVYTYTTAGSYAHLLAEVGDASGRRLMLTAYDTEGRATQQWDGAGRLIVDIDFSQPGAHVSMEDGVTMTHAYDGRNTLIGSIYTCSDGTPGCGTGSGISYDGNFRQNDVADGNGHGAVLDWNAAGSNLETVQNALGDETHMGYDQYNNLTRTIDARSNATQYTYGHPDFPTFLTSMTDALGNTTLYTPTTLSDGVPGLLKATRDANGRVTTYQYNPYGQVTQQVVAAGTPEAITTTYGYDALGRLISTTQTSAAESHTSLNVYDAGDRLSATVANWTGSNPATWQNECTIPATAAAENVCTRYGYDDAGRQISMTNALGQTSLTFYDDAGRRFLSVSNYDGAAYSASDPAGTLCDFANPDPEFNHCSLSEFDPYGRVVTTTDSIGRQAVTEYDSLGRVKGTIVNSVNVTTLAGCTFPPAQPDRDLCTLYQYDNVGNTVSVTDPLGRQTRSYYDALNRVVRTIENWKDSAGPVGCASLPRERDENICTQYQYDEVGNTLFVINTLSQTSRTFYDELNRVVASVANWQPGFNDPSQCHLSPDNTDEENICTLYGYDSAGNQVTTTNALNQTTLTVYDAANRPFLTVQNWDRSTVIDEVADCQFPPAQADVNVCAVTFYDSLGRRHASQDALGNLITYDYDGLGRTITTTQTLTQLNGIAIPITRVVSYDALGNQRSITNANGHSTTYEYDSLNRLVKTTSATGIISTQAYNAAGWVITRTNGLGHETVTGYDLLGRRLTLTNPLGHVTTYAYDALGNQVQMVDAEGITTTYTYDGLNRLVRVIENDVPNNTTPTVDRNVVTTYAYDALGNRVVITNARGFTSTFTLYDGLNRPVVVADALGHQMETSYSALGQRAVVTDANGALTHYSYDGLNRMAVVTTLADGEVVTTTTDALGHRLAMTDSVGVTTYAYDNLYRLLTVTNPFNEVVGYRYDKMGNRTHLIYPDGRTVTTTYDLDNRLVQVADWDGGLTRYGYDAAGRLITTTLPNGVATIYAYDAANRLAELTHTDTSDGRLLARYAYAYDNMGNRTAVTETMRLPQSAGQARLPAGVARGEDAPLTAEEAVAAIQPAEIALDKDHLARPSQQEPPPEPPPLPPDTGSGETLTIQPATPLGLDAVTPPFDPATIAERARNQLETVPGGRAAIRRPGHAAAFAASGELTFVPVLSDTGPLTLTLEPAVPLTVAVRLAAVRQGSHNLPITPAPGQREIAENVISQPRGPWLVEEFVARDGGIEQRWRLDSPPPHSGGLTLAVEATTALSLTVDEAGFVFHAPTLEGDMVPIVRYGRALAIDANGAEQWAALSFTQLPAAPDGRHRYRLRMTISATWLATAHYPLLIDPLLSNLVRLEQAAPANNQNTPEVAYNPDEDEFLLVWRDYRNGNWDIYGQRVNGDGALLDENFIVTNASYEQSHPRLAYGNGVYLVIWRHYPPTTYYDVRGAIISGTGEIVANSLPIATNNSKYEHVNDVVFNSTSNEFLVLWQERGTYWDVWGRHVAADGSMGSAFQVTSQANWHEENTAAAYNPEDDEYLVVWRRNAGGSTQLAEGQRLDGDGTLLGPVIDIGDGGGQERDPDVIYLAGADRYVAVWRDNRHSGSSSWDIYGQLLETDGTLDGSNFVIAAAAVEETTPRLAVDANSGGALVVWRHNAGGSAGYDLYGRLLDSQGEVAGSSFAVQTENGHQELPVLAQNSAGDFLVAWHDNRHGSQDIFTRLRLADGSWGGAGMAHPAPGDQEKPQIAYNPDDDEYLVVWQDYRSSTDWDIYGQRVAGDGSLVGQNIAIDTTGTKHQIRPTVAYGANEYLVAWQHYTDNNNTTYDVYGRVIARSGSFVTSAFVIANASGVGFNTFDESPTDIAYNSSSHQFLVVWETEVSLGNSQWDIWARHVSPSGTMGSYLQIATTASTERDAAAAYNPDSDQYLVVWGSVNKATAVAEVIGRRLTGSGTVTTTDTILISTGWAEDARPDVIYRAASGRYVAAWQQTEDIYSRGVLPDGTLAGSAIVLANTVQKEANPRLAADEAGLLLIWQRHNSSTGDDVYGRALNNSGHPTGSPFPIQETAGAQQRPAIAYGANGRSQLAWQDDREGGWDLYTASLDHRYQVTHIQYDYDPLYRLVSADYSGDFDGEYAYAYDAVGNRTAYTTTITGTTVITYQYDAANRLLESVEVGGDTTTYEWDDAGRLITTTVGLNIRRVYTYSQDGDLTAALVDGLLTTFVYDGQGHRLQMSVADEVVTYTLDYAAGSRVLFEEGGAFSDTKHYLYGLACLGEQVDADDAQNSAWRYYQRDGQNLVRQTTNEETAVTLAWTFTPEGAVLLGEEGPVTNLDCSGNAIYDFSTGLIFKNGNYFDPSNGIWLTLSGAIVWQATWGDKRERKASRKRSKWLMLFLLLLLMLVLIGCNNNPTPTVPPTSCPEPPVLPTGIPGTPKSTPSEPNTPTPFPVEQPAPINWEEVGVFKTSAYYLPSEEDWGSTAVVPIPAAEWTGAEYLSTNEGFYNNNVETAQTASESFLYHRDAVCTQGSGRLKNGSYISCIGDTSQWTDIATGAVREQIKFTWAPPGRISRLTPFETVAVCPTGQIPYPMLDNAGNLQGETPQLKLEGEGIESFFRNRGKDNIVEVVDVGEGLCPENNNWGRPLIDIYIGVGVQAYNSSYLDAINAGDTTVYIKR